MATYKQTELPEELPEGLEELKALSDSIKAVRTSAETDVQEGREQMDVCDRQIKKVKAKIEGIIGIQPIPSRPPKRRPIDTPNS